MPQDPAPFVNARVNISMSSMLSSLSLEKRDLCKAEILASSRHGREDLLSEGFVGLIFWEIKF